MDFGARIKERRLELNKTLEDVAAVVGVGKATVQRWESGVIANLRRDKISKLAQALNVSPAYLMGWTEEKENAPILDERIWQAINGIKDLYDFVLQLMELSEEQREKVISAGLFLLRQEKGEQ